MAPRQSPYSTPTPNPDSNQNTLNPVPPQNQQTPRSSSASFSQTHQSSQSQTHIHPRAQQFALQSNQTNPSHTQPQSQPQFQSQSQPHSQPIQTISAALAQHLLDNGLSTGNILPTSTYPFPNGIQRGSIQSDGQQVVWQGQGQGEGQQMVGTSGDSGAGGGRGGGGGGGGGGMEWSESVGGNDEGGANGETGVEGGNLSGHSRPPLSMQILPSQHVQPQQLPLQQGGGTGGMRRVTQAEYQQFVLANAQAQAQHHRQQQQNQQTQNQLQAGQTPHILVQGYSQHQQPTGRPQHLQQQHQQSVMFSNVPPQQIQYLSSNTGHLPQTPHPQQLHITSQAVQHPQVSGQSSMMTIHPSQLHQTHSPAQSLSGGGSISMSRGASVQAQSLPNASVGQAVPSLAAIPSVQQRVLVYPERREEDEPTREAEIEMIGLHETPRIPRQQIPATRMSTSGVGMGATADLGGAGAGAGVGSGSGSGSDQMTVQLTDGRWVVMSRSQIAANADSQQQHQLQQQQRHNQQQQHQQQMLQHAFQQQQRQQQVQFISQAQDQNSTSQLSLARLPIHPGQAMQQQLGIGLPAASGSAVQQGGIQTSQMAPPKTTVTPNLTRTSSTQTVTSMAPPRLSRQQSTTNIRGRKGVKANSAESPVDSQTSPMNSQLGTLNRLPAAPTTARTVAGTPRSAQGSEAEISLGQSPAQTSQVASSPFPGGGPPMVFRHATPQSLALQQTQQSLVARQVGNMRSLSQSREESMARQANQQRAGSVRIVTGPEAGSESGCGPEVNGEEAVMMEIDGDAEIKHAWEAKSVDSPGWNAELMTPGKALMRVMQFGLELSNAGKYTQQQWDQVLEQYFSDDGCLSYHLVSKDRGERGEFDIPRQSLGRFFMIHQQSGLLSMSMSLFNPNESHIDGPNSSQSSPTASVMVESTSASLSFKYANGCQVISTGIVRVILNPGFPSGHLKFERLEWIIESFEEFIPRSNFRDAVMETPRLDSETSPGRAGTMKDVEGSNTSPESSALMMVKSESFPGEVGSAAIPLPTPPTSLAGEVKLNKHGRPMTKLQLARDAREQEHAAAIAATIAAEAMSVEEERVVGDPSMESAGKEIAEGEEEDGIQAVMISSLQSDSRSRPRQILVEGTGIPASPVNEFGVTPQVMRFLQMVKVMSTMTGLFANDGVGRYPARQILKEAVAIIHPIAEPPIAFASNHSAVHSVHLDSARLHHIAGYGHLRTVSNAMSGMDVDTPRSLQISIPGVIGGTYTGMIEGDEQMTATPTSYHMDESMMGPLGQALGRTSTPIDVMQLQGTPRHSGRSLSHLGFETGAISDNVSPSMKVSPSQVAPQPSGQTFGSSGLLPSPPNLLQPPPMSPANSLALSIPKPGTGAKGNASHKKKRTLSAMVEMEGGSSSAEVEKDAPPTKKTGKGKGKKGKASVIASLGV